MIRLLFEPSQVQVEFCRKHGMYDLGGYLHCRFHASSSSRAKYTLYEGCWGNTISGYCDVVQLRVIRDDSHRPILFQSIEEAHAWAVVHGRLRP